MDRGATTATAPAGFQNDIVPSERSFYHALQGTRTAFILECKKASPSKGLIRENFDPVEIATVYKDFASAISVLTDEKYFRGSFDFLPLVSKTVSQPVLCKDFIIDPYQIYGALLSGRRHPADAVGVDRRAVPPAGGGGPQPEHGRADRSDQ